MTGMYCRFADKCRYAHGRHELPTPPASNQNNQQYNQVAPPTSFAQNQYQGFHPRDPHQMRGGRQQHQPNRGGRGGNNFL